MRTTLCGTRMVSRAAAIAYAAHAGVFRADGTPYVEHPHQVAATLARAGFGPNEIAAGWLHDVVEDSEWTLDSLAKEGFPAAVVKGVDAVTKRAGEDPIDAVIRAALDEVGLPVKLSDNGHNSLPSQRVALPLKKRFDGDISYAVRRSILLSALYCSPTATPLNAEAKAHVEQMFAMRGPR
jgi:hypothetical protein